MLPLGTAQADGFKGQTSGGGFNRQGAMREGGIPTVNGKHTSPAAVQVACIRGVNLGF